MYPGSEGITCGGGNLQQPGEQPATPIPGWNPADAVHAERVCAKCTDVVHQERGDNELDRPPSSGNWECHCLPRECVSAVEKVSLQSSQLSRKDSFPAPIDCCLSYEEFLFKGGALVAQPVCHPVVLSVGQGVGHEEVGWGTFLGSGSISTGLGRGKKS